jgi:hypothetical protein
MEEFRGLSDHQRRAQRTSRLSKRSDFSLSFSTALCLRGAGQFSILRFVHSRQGFDGLLESLACKRPLGLKPSGFAARRPLMERVPSAADEAYLPTP